MQIEPLLRMIFETESSTILHWHTITFMFNKSNGDTCPNRCTVNVVFSSCYSIDIMLPYAVLLKVFLWSVKAFGARLSSCKLKKNLNKITTHFIGISLNSFILFLFFCLFLARWSFFFAYFLIILIWLIVEIWFLNSTVPLMATAVMIARLINLEIREINVI